MKTQISLGFLLFSILYAGVVPMAWGNDSMATPANEVARKSDRVVASGYNSYLTPKKNGMGVKYANAGFIVSDLAPVGTIVKLFDNKLATSGPDEIFVELGKRQGVERGDRFTVYSLARYVYHPVLPGRGFEKLGEYSRRVGYGSKDLISHPGKPIGHQVMIRGVIEITEVGDKVSYARVVKAYESIESGHLLMPYQKLENPTPVATETDKTIEGYIVAAKRDKIGLMNDDVIYIDKGWDDQVRPGDHFEVYSIPTIEENVWYKPGPKTTALLPYVLGKIKVIATQKKTATAIVVKSRLDMQIGDKIRFKRSNHPG